jgi:predicted lipoprotein with Yx(FWY)xxD motif
VSVRSRPAHAVIALASLIVLAAACGDDDDDASSEPAATTAAPSEPAATTAAPAGSATVEVVDSELGEILASGGKTLYIFMPDNGGAPTCYDDCAANWPALLVEGDVTVGEGLDAGLFATATRDDGGEQVTVDGWPLYFFANDAAPGDINGQGVGDVWYVVAPDGTPIDND